MGSLQGESAHGYRCGWANADARAAAIAGLVVEQRKKRPSSLGKKANSVVRTAIAARLAFDRISGETGIVNGRYMGKAFWHGAPKHLLGTDASALATERALAAVKIEGWQFIDKGDDVGRTSLDTTSAPAAFQNVISARPGWSDLSVRRCPSQPK